ncbi:MAG: hypothetical protein J6D37_06295 [Clostridia bacterium]|nr:hypothetical protein [Clostridia bacterium]
MENDRFFDPDYIQCVEKACSLAGVGITKEIICDVDSLESKVAFGRVKLRRGVEWDIDLETVNGIFYELNFTKNVSKKEALAIRELDEQMHSRSFIFRKNAPDTLFSYHLYQLGDEDLLILTGRFRTDKSSKLILYISVCMKYLKRICGSWKYRKARWISCNDRVGVSTKSK